MKLYLILSPSISAMGGAQMYTSNKCKYLSEIGWTPIVFSAEYGDILIDNLKVFDKYRIPELAWGIQYLPPKTVYKVIDTISSLCRANCFDEILIESQLQILSFWGELLAKTTGGKHIMNYLEEDIPKCSERVALFYKFKLYRGEILNSSVSSLKRLFGKYYEDSFAKYEFRSSFLCSNVVDDSLPDVYQLAPSRFTILSLGRLEKSYIMPITKQIALFAQSVPSDKINVMFIGGSVNGDVEIKISNMLASHANITTYFWGNMYPIPTCLLMKADLCIATSNSVIVSYEAGVPSIAIDANDCMPIGIYGVTTWNKVFRHGESQRPLLIWLNEILLDAKHTFSNCVLPKREKVGAGFDAQMRHIEESSAEKEYYDIFRTFSFAEHIICGAKRLASMCR